MSHHPIRDTILSRWRHDDVPRLQPVKAALVRILDAHDDVRERHAAIASDQKLSPLGRQDAQRKYIGEATAAELRLAQATVKTMRAGLDKWRARLQPKPESTTQLRGEMRQMLRGMKHHERIALLMDKDCDPEFQLAAIEAPNMLTGITQELREYVVGQVVERTHPGQLAAIEQAEEAIGLLNAAVGVVTNTIRVAADFPSEVTFNAFLDASLGPRAAAIDADTERKLDAA